MKPTDNKMFYVKHSKPIDFDNIPLDDVTTSMLNLQDQVSDKIEKAFASISKTIVKQISTEVRNSFRDFGPAMYFPIQFTTLEKPEDGLGGKPPEDPVTLYVELPLGLYSADDKSVFSISLESVVDELIDCANSYSGNQDSFKKVAMRLRQLADKLDKAFTGTESA